MELARCSVLDCLRSSLPLLSLKFHTLFADFDVTTVKNLWDYVRSVLQVVIDEIRGAVSDFVQGELLLRIRFDVGKTIIVENRGDVEGCFVLFIVVIELQLASVAVLVLINR